MHGPCSKTPTRAHTVQLMAQACVHVPLLGQIIHQVCSSKVSFFSTNVWEDKQQYTIDAYNIKEGTPALGLLQAR